MFLAAAAPAGASGPGYIEGLVKKASRTRLWEARDWEALLHYRGGVLGGRTSYIDDPRFFNAPDGKHNPESELTETLKAFFSLDLTGDAHPLCRFPARYVWLRERLGIDEAQLPSQVCRERDTFMSTLDPKAAALVFPVGYMNSPASMFGHTLLRIDSGGRNDLLGYAVNYAAGTGDSFGVSYAFRGIFGLYDGLYSVLPYYDKINEYGYMESRDIWEYSLSLSEAEVKRMTRHLWELKDITSRYFFFDENCSYNLLLLIESARPRLDLTGGFSLLVIPSDTIRAVLSSGLVSGTKYRPSLAARIRHLSSLLPAELRDKAARVAEGSLPPGSLAADPAAGNREKAMALDAAADYLRYLHAENRTEQEQYSRSLMDILEARSKRERTDYDITPPPRPEEGHRSSLMAVGGGRDTDGPFSSIRLRYAYHDLLDSDVGYLAGAALAFGDTELRYLHRRRSLVLQSLNLIDITSLTPVDRFFKPVSWEVRTGLQRERVSKDRDRLVGYLRTGGGGAVELMLRTLLFGLVEPEARAGGALAADYSVGMGASVGMLSSVTDRYKVLARGRLSRSFLGEQATHVSMELGQSFAVGADNALRLTVSRSAVDGYYQTEVRLSWDHHY